MKTICFDVLEREWIKLWLRDIESQQVKKILEKIA